MQEPCGHEGHGNLSCSPGSISEVLETFLFGARLQE